VLKGGPAHQLGWQTRRESNSQASYKSPCFINLYLVTFLYEVVSRQLARWREADWLRLHAQAPSLPGEAVAAPSLAVLKARLDGALSTLGWWKMSLLMAGGLEPGEL